MVADNFTIFQSFVFWLWHLLSYLSLCITTVVYLRLDYACVLFYYWLNNQYRVHGNNGIYFCVLFRSPRSPFVVLSMLCREWNSTSKKESNKTKYSNSKRSKKKHTYRDTFLGGEREREKRNKAAHTVTFYCFVPRTSNQIHRKTWCAVVFFLLFIRSVCFHIIFISAQRRTRDREGC